MCHFFLVYIWCHFFLCTFFLVPFFPVPFCQATPTNTAQGQSLMSLKCKIRAHYMSVPMVW